MFLRRQNISTESKIVERTSVASPYQNTNGLLYRNRTIILKFVWKYKRLQVAKITLRKNNITL